jgi:glycerol-1-phosphate dehydrogenase [NAD(P)+]
MPPPDAIAELLAGTYRDPETGEALACEARGIAIEDSLVGREVELVEALGVGTRFAVIGDVDTYAALGDRVATALESRFAIQRVVLPAHPHCDVTTIDAVTAGLDAGVDAVIAVGSGTINDVSKMTAQARGIPQLVFGTAPSMNGYTSVSASVTDRGFKRSVRARTPVGVFLDLGVLAAAPKRLIHAGLGDSACRPTAQTDWLMAHLVIDTPYRTVPFVLLADDEPRLFGDAAALVADTRDLGAMRALARTLVLSGFGMTLAGGSYPASQGEHLISHYLEMMKPAHLAEAHHGEQIGVAAIVMATLQRAIIERAAPPLLHATRATRDDVLSHFGPLLGEACWRELSLKALDDARAESINARLAAWPDIRARLAATSSSPERITQILAAAGAPTSPSDLHYPEALFANAVAHASEIRDRFTFLDLHRDAVTR